MNQTQPTSVQQRYSPKRMQRRWKWKSALYLALLWGSAPAALQAQDPLFSGEAAAIHQRLEQQEAEIQWLRNQLLQRPDMAPPADGSADPALTSEFGGSPPSEFASFSQDGEKKKDEKKDEKKDGWTDLSSEKWTVKLGGHMQADYIQWANADPQIPAQNYFEFRRLRLLADGTGYGVYDFRIQMDIEPEAEDTVTTPVTVIKDAYLTMHEVAVLQRTRIGNFFVPFSLEQVTNDTNNIFMERSIPTQGIFAADREVGVAMYGVNADQDVTWTFGAFLDSISEALKERIDDNQGSRLSGRLTWLPYYDEPSNGRYLIHTGAGILYTNDQDNLVRFRARPQIHEGPFLIDSGNIVANEYTTANLEFATVWGNMSAQSEVFACSVNQIGNTSSTFYGGYLYGSYFLTGENRIYDRYGQHGAQFARNVPYTNFFLVPGCFGSGAWEAKARMSYLDLNDANRGQYTDMTVGMNWYWTDRIRVMFDWIHPWTTANTPFGATESDVAATRFDFNF